MLLINSIMTYFSLKWKIWPVLQLHWALYISVIATYNNSSCSSVHGLLVRNMTIKHYCSHFIIHISGGVLLFKCLGWHLLFFQWCLLYRRWSRWVLSWWIWMLLWQLLSWPNILLWIKGPCIVSTYFVCISHWNEKPMYCIFIIVHLLPYVVMSSGVKEMSFLSY